MRNKIWRAIEVAAYVVFCLEIMLIWVNMLGDYHRITYDLPLGSLWLPICAIVAGVAHDRRTGGGGGPYYP